MKLDGAMATMGSALQEAESLLPEKDHILMVFYRGQYAEFIIGEDYSLEMKEKCFDKCKYFLLRKEYLKRKFQRLLDHGVPQDAIEKMPEYQEVMSNEEG